jgi:hypothetical protein
MSDSSSVFLIFVRRVVLNRQIALLVWVSSAAETDQVVVAETSAATTSLVCSSATSIAIVTLCLFYYVVIVDYNFTFDLEVVAQS